jgi:signal transduction histidine kinase/CheY-like chemotaxis protein
MTIRLMARPLSLLQDGITSIREGRLEPVQVSRTGDEIEFLGESFNRMIEELARSRQELLQNQELLEDRIKERTQQLEVAMQNALAASQVKSEFLANISHELRTPMNGILGMIDIVLGSDLNAEQRDHLQTAQGCAYSLLALLNDVLDLSKIEAGRMALEKIPFELRALIADSKKAQTALALQKGVELRTVIEPDVPHRVIGDPLRIRQMLINLLSNAAKFTDRGWIELRVRTAGDTTAGNIMLILEVADTGMGIAADKLPTIFDKFTQADSSISRRFGGSGLGLAITKVLAEMHGGTVAVESELGVGSTFTVTIECEISAERVEPEHSHAMPATHVSLATPGAGGSVLLVEDNPVNQKLVASILQKRGYHVVISGNGREALKVLREQEFQLVLMDVQMPEMDGLETTRLIRQDRRWSELPIVAMTAHAMNGDREGCLAAGMNGYISKPVHSAHLLSIVEEFAVARK